MIVRFTEHTDLVDIPYDTEVERKVLSPVQIRKLNPVLGEIFATVHLVPRGVEHISVKELVRIFPEALSVIDSGGNLYLLRHILCIRIIGIYEETSHQKRRIGTFYRRIHFFKHIRRREVIRVHKEYVVSFCLLKRRVSRARCPAVFLVYDMYALILCGIPVTYLTAPVR